jgi:hypothetical protein
LSAVELSADKLVLGELSADELSADELLADKLLADELLADELLADKLPLHHFLVLLFLFFNSPNTTALPPCFNKNLISGGILFLRQMSSGHVSMYEHMYYRC